MIVNLIVKAHWTFYVLVAMVLVLLVLDSAISADQVSGYPIEKIGIFGALAFFMVYPAVVSYFRREQIRRDAERAKYESIRQIPFWQARPK